VGASEGACGGWAALGRERGRGASARERGGGLRPESAQPRGEGFLFPFSFLFSFP
jgi:hypothetical protein